MKKIMIIFICLLMLCSCQNSSAVGVDDGRDRPSNSGKLMVKDGRLCNKNGEPVMLRGISINDVFISETLINPEAFADLSRLGINVFRLAMYTWGFGSVGYCTGGDQERLKTNVLNGVEYAKENDMYAIIDWHILEDNDPNRYIEESKAFFAEMSAEFKDYNNVLYEICNEPNGIEWPAIKAYAEVIIPIIRSNDPDALIIVGTPGWSHDVDAAAADPLDYNNIMYTLHFYSATDKQETRDKAMQAIAKGLPIFVTEYGVTAANGSFPFDYEEADTWIDLLEKNGISYVMWQYSRAQEGSAALSRENLKTSGFEYEDFSPAGQWLLDTIAAHK